METNATLTYEDQPVSTRVLLAGMWTSLVLLFAYIDIFSGFRADFVEGVLDGKIAGTDFQIDQQFLVIVTLFIVPACLMVALTLMLPARINRIVNIVASGFYALSAIGSSIGEEWIYFILGSAVECVVLAMIAWKAWTWPRA